MLNNSAVGKIAEVIFWAFVMICVGRSFQMFAYTVVTCCCVALGDTWCCCGTLPKALDELEKGHQPQAHESDAQTAKLSEKRWGNVNVSLSPQLLLFATEEGPFVGRMMSHVIG